jgi:hypothetical protein
VRILLSFHYYRRTDLDALVARFSEPPEVFADSGAFSAKHQGANINLAEYVEWLRRWRHLFATYVNLDVIGDPAATLANQRLMEDVGLRPVPVFHGGEPWEYLADYCAEHAYVALGGMVATGDADAVLRWCVRAHQLGAEHGTRFHGFGQTKRQVLKALPWYSVDSSSWGAGHRAGQLRLWDHKRARLRAVKVGDHAAVYRNAELIRAHAGNPADYARPGWGFSAEGKSTEQLKAERYAILRLNLVSWLRFEQYLRARHGTIPPPPGHAEPGPMVYLAEGSGDHLVLAGRAADEWAAAQEVLAG